MKAIVEATGFPEINNLLFVWSSISKCVKKFVCSVLYILFAAHSIFCLQRVLYFVCSVLYILFAACSIFCLQCVLYFSAARSIFCLHRVLYFVCSVFYILFAARSIFCLQRVLYFVCSTLFICLQQISFSLLQIAIACDIHNFFCKETWCRSSLQDRHCYYFSS
jgi:hypothetical protein